MMVAVLLLLMTHGKQLALLLSLVAAFMAVSGLGSCCACLLTSWR
jgi:hypothetical protein